MQYYSGSISTTYPASEHGGRQTVSYQGQVPVELLLDVYVDTDPYDSASDRCRDHIDTLAGAVVATEAAEVLAKKQSAQKIGDAVIDGFFSYIRQDLTQQISQLSAKAEALLLELVEQRKACIKKQQQMADDYSRITNRYSKLFDDLDHELSSRIHQLDLPTFSTVNHISCTVTRPMDTELLGIATISQQETARIDSVVACSSIKNRTKGLIDDTRRFLGGVYRLTNSINGMLTNDDCGTCYVPVAYVETVGDNGQLERDILVNEGTEVCRSKQALEQRFASRDLEWVAISHDAADAVDAFFNDTLANSGVDRRVAATMVALKKQNELKTIKK